jgi:nucleotide-binding universal stress UspA family protein
MRTILAVLWSEQDAERVLGTAFLVAGRFKAHVAAIYVRPGPENFVPSGDFGLTLSQDYLSRIQEEGVAKATRLRHLFDRAAAAQTEATGEWIEEEGSAALKIGCLGRIYDLVVLSRPDPKTAAETDILLEAALFETGRAVLTVPPAPVPSVGNNVMIAWNGSTETARAIALGLPLLQQAKLIHVVSVEGGTVPGPSGGEVARYLQRYGLEVTASHIENPTAPVGETQLSEAARLGCDMMVKGAYTQSRLRQLVFGGPTRHIIAHAMLPVLMAH